MWYGLWVNGELMRVQWFRYEPCYMDFSLGYFCSLDDYEVEPVAVLRYAHHGCA